jgi:hypothetical protein
MRSRCPFYWLFDLLNHRSRPIEADILLTSKSPLGTGGAFGVHAYTTNGPVKIVCGDSPVDFVLDFKAVNELTCPRRPTPCLRGY